MCCYVYKKLATYLTKHVALALVLFSRKRRYICLFNIQTTLEGSHEPSPIQCYMYIYNLLQLCITNALLNYFKSVSNFRGCVIAALAVT